jgi:hypothetical protein
MRKWCLKLDRRYVDSGVLEAPLLLLFTWVFTCLTVSAASAQGSSTAELTNYPSFVGLCAAMVTDYVHSPMDPLKLVPVLGNYMGHCQVKAHPMLLSVTQENPQNTHIGAANNLTGLSSHMNDFNIGSDLGSWVRFQMTQAEQPVVTLGLDLIHTHKINVTGWPLQYGHVFVGLTDLSVRKEAISSPICMTFDIRNTQARVDQDGSGSYSGYRILVGALGTWAEAPPRKNHAHFLAIDLLRTPGYGESYGQRDLPLCNDVRYTRCYYSKDGQYSEGRVVNFNKNTEDSLLTANNSQWTHVAIPVASIFEQLQWASPPASWEAATISGVYFGIEAEGSSDISIDVKNYNVTTDVSSRRCGVW